MSYRSSARKPGVQGMPDKPDHRRRVYQDITQLIANPDNPTPMVRLNRMNSRSSFEIYCKLEWFNPFGSVKDRAAKYLIEGLLERGLLNGQRLVEPTSGNTGIALTAIGNVKGYQTTITIPEAVPEEKQTLLNENQNLKETMSQLSEDLKSARRQSYQLSKTLKEAGFLQLDAKGNIVGSEKKKPKDDDDVE